MNFKLNQDNIKYICLSIKEIIWIFEKLTFEMVHIKMCKFFKLCFFIKRYIVTYKVDMDKVYKEANKNTLKMKLYMCNECNHTPFKTKAGRNKHEKKVQSFERYLVFSSRITLLLTYFKSLCCLIDM